MPHFSFPSLSVAIGDVPHIIPIDVSYRNPDVDAATVPETVWPVGGLATFRSAAAVIELISDSVADDADPAGTGARTVRIDGLDANYVRITETVALNGTTAVTTAKEFLRINDVRVTLAGSGKANAGNITLRDAGAGTIRSYISAGRSRSEVGLFTVPAGCVVAATDWIIASRLSTGQTGADFQFWATKDGVRTISWEISGAGTTSIDPTTAHIWTEKTDIEVIVSFAASNDTNCTLHGHGVLIEPNVDL